VERNIFSASTTHELAHISSDRKNSHPHRMKQGGLAAFGGIGGEVFLFLVPQASPAE